MRKIKRVLDPIKDKADNRRDPRIREFFRRQRRKELEFYGYLTRDFEGLGERVVFLSKEDGLAYQVQLDEELYQAIVRAIKRAPPAKRDAAKSAALDPVTGKGSWLAAKSILMAAAAAGIDVREIVRQLTVELSVEQSGRGSKDDGLIYILKHAKDPIVKIGKTKSVSAQRATDYTVAHDDEHGWFVEHEVLTKNVSAVEARIHQRLMKFKAAYGFNAKEVFAIPVTVAMQAVYREIEL